MSDVYIVSAVRTPIGKQLSFPSKLSWCNKILGLRDPKLSLSLGSFNGTLSKLKASDLGSVVIKEALRRANVEAQQVNEVIMGQV